MNRTLCTLLIGASALGIASHAVAADMPEPMAPIVEMASEPSIYVQLLGGFVAALDTDYYEGGDIDTTYETEPGFAVAATLGVMVMENLSLEADVMYSKRSYAEPYPDDTTTSLSFMGNVKYTVPVGDQFAIYGAVGLGHISISEYVSSSDTTDDYSGFGYQLILGAAVEVADNASVVAEVRYQNTFGEAAYDEDDYYGVQAPNLSLLAGVKFSF